MVLSPPEFVYELQESVVLCFLVLISFFWYCTAIDEQIFSVRLLLLTYSYMPRHLHSEFHFRSHI